MKLKFKAYKKIGLLIVLYLVLALVMSLVNSLKIAKPGFKLEGLVSMIRANGMDINSVVKQKNDLMEIIGSDCSDSGLVEIVYDGVVYIDNFSKSNLKFDHRNSKVIFLYSKAKYKCLGSSFPRFVASLISLGYYRPEVGVYVAYGDGTVRFVHEEDFQREMETEN